MVFDRGATTRGKEPAMLRGMIFTSDSVRAFRGGQKTMTRRVVNLDRLAVVPRGRVGSDLPSMFGDIHVEGGKRVHVELNPHGAVSAVLPDGKKLGLKPGEFDFVCPYAQGRTSLIHVDSKRYDSGRWIIEPVDSRVYAKETWSKDCLSVYPCPRLWYKADFDWYDDPAKESKEECKHNPTQADCWSCAGKFQWRSPLFMPRWASRVHLVVTSVRLERLQDITAADARREGITPSGDDQADVWSYSKAWDAINGKKSPWAGSPWVWAIGLAVGVAR